MLILNTYVLKIKLGKVLLERADLTGMNSLKCFMMFGVVTTLTTFHVRLSQILAIVFFFLLHLFAAFGAILQGSLFGLGGMLPASYTTPIMSGQGLAGAFAAFSMICALACMCSSSIALEPSTLCFQVLTLNLVFSSGLWVTGQRFRLLHHSLCRYSPGHRFLPRPAQIGMV